MGLHTLLTRLGLAKSAPTSHDRMTAALHTSVASIAKDADPMERALLLDETLEQYRDAVLSAMSRDTLLAPVKKGGKLPPAIDDDEEADDDADAGSGEEDDDEAASGSSEMAGDDTDDDDHSEEDDEMDQKLKKQYEDRIRTLEDKLREADVAKATVTSLTKRLEEIEARDAERAALAKAREVLGDGASSEEVAKLAGEIRKGFDVSVIESLAKQREAFAKAAALTLEVGSAAPASGDTTARAQLAKAAEEVAKAHPSMTPEQALDVALQQNPKLYDALIARPS